MEFKERDIYLRKMKEALIIFLVGIIAALACHFLLSPRYDVLKESIGHTSTLAKQISGVMEESKSYEQTIESSGKVFDNLVTNKDKYVSFIGGIAQQNQLNINKMTVDDIKQGKKLYTMKVEIEVQGQLYNIKNMIQELYDSETVSRISSISYRLQSARKLQWMWRTIDDKQLVSWWNVSGQKGTQQSETKPEEVAPLCSQDLMEHGTALCYLEVEFLGTGG